MHYAAQCNVLQEDHNRTHNPLVGDSNPSGPTKESTHCFQTRMLVDHGRLQVCMGEARTELVGMDAGIDVNEDAFGSESLCGVAYDRIAVKVPVHRLTLDHMMPSKFSPLLQGRSRRASAELSPMDAANGFSR